MVNNSGSNEIAVHSLPNFDPNLCICKSISCYSRGIEPLLNFFLGPPIFVNFNSVWDCIFLSFFLSSLSLERWIFFFFLILKTTVNLDHDKITAFQIHFIFHSEKKIVYFCCKNSFSSTMKIIISFSRNSIIRLFQFSCRLLSTGKPPKLRKFPIIFVHETDNASNDAAKKQLTLIIFHDNNSPLRDSSRFHRISC